MENYLVISALGEDRPGIVNQLSALITDSGCNIYDSRMSVLGGEFAIILLASGKWNELARLEDSLQAQSISLGLNITCKRTQVASNSSPLIPYSVEAIAMDQPGIMHQVANFFSSRQINIQEMHSTRYAAAHTGTPMFAMHMMISIPAEVHIATLRNEFLDFTEAMNIDATIEPLKP